MYLLKIKLKNRKSESNGKGKVIPCKVENYYDAYCRPKFITSLDLSHGKLKPYHMTIQCLKNQNTYIGQLDKKTVFNMK